MVKLVCRTCTFAKLYNLLVQGEQAHHAHTHVPALPLASVNLARARIDPLTTPQIPYYPPSTAPLDPTIQFSPSSYSYTTNYTYAYTTNYTSTYNIWWK